SFHGRQPSPPGRRNAPSADGLLVASTFAPRMLVGALRKRCRTSRLGLNESGRSPRRRTETFEPLGATGASGATPKRPSISYMDVEYSWPGYGHSSFLRQPDQMRCGLSTLGNNRRVLIGLA